MSAFYSIIIPHYNIPQLLKRCLESIPRRDDVQVIVVDDCSRDDVRTELKGLQALFPTFHFVYSVKNDGGGAARNIGLQQATGDYVLFADADDFFHDCINDVFDDYQDETCDIVYFNADSVDSETYCVRSRADRLQGQIEDSLRGTDKDFLGLRYQFTEPWCKMIRRSLIERFQIRFDETPSVNDATFSYMVGYHAKTIKVDRRKAYCIVHRKDSITFTKSLVWERMKLEVMARKNRFMIDHGIPVFDAGMFYPFSESYHRKDWKSLDEYFGIARDNGFSKSYILFKLVLRSLKYRILNAINSKR
ncbi:MAG: glycosyltransferase family 2 protein [Prevotella sp.]|nr:glycosyltransferase family 2 protein [Prevotella sp.]